MAKTATAPSTALRADGSVEGADVYAQTVATYDKIEAALQAAGAALTDVVRVTAYITDIGHSDGFIRAQTERFTGGLVPAAALIGGAQLLRPELLIEIEATAVITQD
jgi:enamine deaminase RidA (YjgF/YER057c/UK114 family)